MNKKLVALLATLSLCTTIVGCSTPPSTSSSSGETLTNIQSNTEDTDEDIDLENVKATITLGDTINVDGSGATVNSNTVTIDSSGVYNLSGSLADGQIIINSQDTENVYLVLADIDITCSTSSPINVVNAKNTIIVLKDGSENHVTDGSSYLFEDTTTDEPNAAIFSKDDLTIKGTGSLTVTANYNNGITSKDDLKITGGNITVTAVADGLRGKDSITIKGGDITVNAEGDGLKSNNAEDDTKGYITVEGGTLNITAGEDGIQAETNLTVNAGDITISSGGGSANSSSNTNEVAPGGNWGNWGPKDGNTAPTSGASQNTNTPSSLSATTTTTESTSAKGIKAVNDITINGGSLNIDSSDDSIHSNNTLTLNGGTINLASGDDGIHSDTSLAINSSDITINKSYEGIESTDITINGGNISLVSSDDGLNAAGGNDSSSVSGRPGQNGLASSSSGSITINGGYLYVDASGDGIDANGSVSMTGGTVIVNGPSDSGNGALDYDSAFDITGGILLAAGSSGMLQTPSSSSSQASTSIALGSQEANTIVRIEDASGNELITFAPSKTFQSLIVSSPELSNGETYKIYYGGTSTGTSENGLYADGSYSGGTEFDSFTVSSSVTSVGSAGGMNGGGIPGGGKGGMKGQMP